MSSYLGVAGFAGEKCYIKKLETVGPSLEDDSYSVGKRFNSDMINWPKIEYGHIFITRSGTYTQQELVSWKQMEAYNYFESGYVREVPAAYAEMQDRVSSAHKADNLWEAMPMFCLYTP